MINRSVKYLNKICNKKYQPLSLKQAKWVEGDVLTYRDLMRAYYLANGYDIEPAVERDTETGLPLLFEYSLPGVNKEGGKIKIPVSILYDSKAAYNTAAFAFQEEGQNRDSTIYAMLYRIINMGITCETESKKLEKMDQEKVMFKFFLGDIIVTEAENGLLYGLPVKYEVKEIK